ncbi:unnamed protein product [Arabis nemorensis]|uniref:Uncharacterized protein n=1 Tax=Arabis nemorensis TaxID=586526 RepID=A0A565BDV0_9BRAS|nr:unnamed protein product [Arabis nemorensis]
MMSLEVVVTGLWKSFPVNNGPEQRLQVGVGKDSSPSCVGGMGRGGKNGSMYISCRSSNERRPRLHQISAVDWAILSVEQAKKPPTGFQARSWWGNTGDGDLTRSRA